MAKTVLIPLDLNSYRPSPAATEWDLPPWGHPISQFAMPLFISLHDSFIPIGTAFTIGRSLTFVVTAEHNIHEALKHEPHLQKYLFDNDFPKSMDLKHVGLFVLYQARDADGQIQIAFWPLETVDAARPTDVVIGFPQFQSHLPTISIPISFDLPEREQAVQCVGYTNFKFPSEGIPRAAVEARQFDWQKDYSHQLKVVSGTVERVFIQRFANGFVKGPCFTFTGEAFHGQSGGPVISEKGLICGVTSAAGTTFFAKPTTIASLFYPLLLSELRFGGSVGPVRINGQRTFADLIVGGVIGSDGSEHNLHIIPSPDGHAPTVGARALKSMTAHIHDDFDGYQQGTTAATTEGELYCLVRKPDNTPS